MHPADPAAALALALRIGVNHDGDSDSTASLAGQVLGAAHGTAVFGAHDPADRAAAEAARGAIEARNMAKLADLGFRFSLDKVQTLDLDFADLAVRLGWYDQAHFINDFRAMLGCTPGEYATKHRR